MAWHLRSEFGVKTIRYQAIPCAWSATSSLFAYTHSSLKPSLCFGFQGYIPLRLPAICVCLCSPLRCETYARSGLHNYASFYPNNSLAQRFWPHNTLDNTPRLYTSSSPRTPRQYALPLFCSRKNNFTKHLVLRQYVTEHRLTYSDMKFIIFQNWNTRAVGGSSQRVVKGNPLSIPINSSYQAIYILKP